MSDDRQTRRGSPQHIDSGAPSTVPLAVYLDALRELAEIEKESGRQHRRPGADRDTGPR